MCVSIYCISLFMTFESSLIYIYLNFSKDVIFPREFMWMNRTPPLFDVRHVRFEMGEIPNDEVVAQLVECLMWFVPKPQTVALTSFGSGKTRTLKVRLTKLCCSFYYQFNCI